MIKTKQVMMIECDGCKMEIPDDKYHLVLKYSGGDVAAHYHNYSCMAQYCQTSPAGPATSNKSHGTIKLTEATRRRLIEAAKRLDDAKPLERAEHCGLEWLLSTLVKAIEN